MCSTDVLCSHIVCLWISYAAIDCLFFMIVLWVPMVVQCFRMVALWFFHVSLWLSYSLRMFTYGFHMCSYGLPIVSYGSPTETSQLDARSAFAVGLAFGINLS